MIQLKMSGRAGNQFFQYLFVTEFMREKKINEKVKISLEHLEQNKTDNKSFKSELDNFCIENIEYIDKICMTPEQKIWDFIFKICFKYVRLKASILHRKIKLKDYKFMNNFIQKHLNKCGLYYYIPGMKKFYPSKLDNYIFYGCYDDYEYYKNCKNIAREIYTPKYNILDNNIELYKKITESNSVCVTIRRGDYLNDEFKEKYFICDNNYFKRGIEKIKEKVENPVFVFFSDDIEWCKNQEFVPENSLFESGEDPIWEKVRLMSACKHFVISNSSFSWWVQFLASNEDKIVIAPEIWNKFEYAEGLYINSWELI